jgi:hypothetical protein
LTAERRRFFFCHLQKTGGTTLIRRIRQNFDEGAVYPYSGDGDRVARVISVEHLLSVWNARSDEIDVVTGHYPLCTTELLGHEFSTLTLLRHPLSRTVSYLRHQRRERHPDADLSLEAIYEDQMRFGGLIHNHMTKMLSLSCEEMDNGALTTVDFTAERLERAMRRLAEVDVVGLQEDFEGFCQQLSVRFDWRVAEAAPHRPRTPCALRPDFRDRILADNADDVELYTFARSLVAERSALPA